jgi:dTDP-glucose 4,6-dehydratase
MQENKVVAITGAAGFIGSNFVHYMHQNYPSYRLIGIDNLGIGSSSGSLSGLAENFKFINADIVDIGQILPLFKQA